MIEYQYGLLNVETEEILEFPFKMFNNDWDFLQEYLEMIGNPSYKINGNLDLSKSNIESLGNLQSVGGYLYLVHTNIESLGNLKYVGGHLNLRHTNIKSLGSLISVDGNLILYGSKIKSLGNLESVGDDLHLGDTPLSKTTTEDEIRNQVDVVGKIIL